MCLAVPLKLIEINGKEAVGESMGMRRSLRVDFIDEPKLGDYISDRIPGCKVLRIPDTGHIVKPSLYQEAFMEHMAAHGCGHGSN